jgi:hypothetical protein
MPASASAPSRKAAQVAASASSTPPAAISRPAVAAPARKPTLSTTLQRAFDAASAAGAIRTTAATPTADAPPTP